MGTHGLTFSCASMRAFESICLKEDISGLFDDEDDDYKTVAKRQNRSLQPDDESQISSTSGKNIPQQEEDELDSQATNISCHSNTGYNTNDETDDDSEFDLFFSQEVLPEQCDQRKIGQKENSEKQIKVYGSDEQSTGETSSKQELEEPNNTDKQLLEESSNSQSNNDCELVLFKKGIANKKSDIEEESGGDTNVSTLRTSSKDYNKVAAESDSDQTFEYDENSQDLFDNDDMLIAPSSPNVQTPNKDNLEYLHQKMAEGDRIQFTASNK
uniref:LisH domain-containing protein C1711.05-like n=1 Tax=Saccoglossus kowalevskii TaxID=10224 RepID=A0ABM0M8P7_SACKO|nr:PREDICTED: lisH domain-containing protein C1711.05-like [Saccoglossus kowalevskii]